MCIPVNTHELDFYRLLFTAETLKDCIFHSTLESLLLVYIQLFFSSFLFSNRKSNQIVNLENCCLSLKISSK